MNTHANYVADRLRNLIRQRVALFRARQALAGIIGLAAILALLATLDFVWVLPRATRWGGLALAVVLVTVLGLWARRKWPASCSQKQAALELESRRDELGVLVSTSTDYSEAIVKAEAVGTLESVRRLHREAAKRLLQVEGGFYRRVFRLTLAVGLFVVTLAAILLKTVPNFRLALERVLLPGASLAYTRFHVVPGNITAAEGSSVKVSGVIRGRFLDQARIEWRKPTQEWNVAAVTPDSRGRFAFALLAETPRILYRLSAGPSHSATYRIGVFSPAKLEDREWSVRLPKYTARPPFQASGEDLEVLRGSDVTLTARFSKPIRNARIRFEDQATIPFAQGPVPTQWLLHFTAKKRHQYWIDFVDMQGRSQSTDEPGELDVMRDEAPTVAIITPGMDIRAKPEQKPKIEVAAEDDYGVREVKLVFQKLTDPEQERVIKLGKPSEQDQTAVTRLDLAPLKLKPYELVAYHAEASDFNDLDGPGIGKSPVYFMEYTTNEMILSRKNGSCNKLNLLDLEKDVIAATTAAGQAEKGKLAEIGSAQQRVIELANIYEKGYRLAAAPEAARREFATAKDNMRQVVSILNEGKRKPAIGKEEEVLAGLYRVVELLPPLQEGMCNGHCQGQKIVLEAIEKLKERQQLQRNQTLKTLLHLAERMKQIQKLLNAQYARTNQASQQAEGDVEAKTQARRATPKANSLSRPPAAELRRLAGEQQQVADTLGDMLKRLQELAGRGAKQALKVGEPLKKARDALSQAAKALNELVSRFDHHSYRSVGVYGFSGYSFLGDFSKQLAALMLKQDASTETAVETVPPVYQAAVSEYLRRLSFEPKAYESSN